MRAFLRIEGLGERGAGELVLELAPLERVTVTTGAGTFKGTRDLPACLLVGERLTVTVEGTLDAVSRSGGYAPWER